ncbi:3-hydroxyacyl-CoA dehydrogenase type-2 [Lachnellula suecica]|uniref:3-hydroxyacyl-CoA dehydrogenase type-2 n=1 Tax=Lachnellula suecica TaxID=602035 RepID=A0A8T9C4U2_9HELO|nr:3-hydroxyacyl-CoA dehydrogenase type-2 [Lachnellula suecica]
MKIEGRTFIVSGGASGLGRACVDDICSRGGYAAILDMNEELAEEAVRGIGGGKAKFFEANVLETESIASAVKGALAWVKETGKEVGGVIAAAGVSTPAKIIDRNLNPFSLDDFDFVMNVNVRGTIDLVRQVVPHMAASTPADKDGERGIIVMVSSSAAFDGQPGQVAYAASKGAIRSLTLPLTRDLARYGIRVVTVAPSIFDSRMTAMMSDKVRASLTRVMEFPLRPGQPHEFAQLVTQSIENIMLNGVVLRLDGGMRMPSKM